MFASLFHVEYFCKGDIKMCKKLSYLGETQSYSF